MSILLRVLFETLVLRDSSLFIGSALSLEAGIRCGLLQLVMPSVTSVEWDAVYRPGLVGQGGVAS